MAHSRDRAEGHGVVTVKDEWINRRVAYIEGLKTPSAQQTLLVELAAKPDRTAAEQRAFVAVVRAEKAAQRALQTRGDAARFLEAKKKAERKARDHELYQSAGLLIMAGLVDSKTGKLLCEPADLLGALIFIARNGDGIKGFASFRDLGKKAMLAHMARKKPLASSSDPEPDKPS